MFNNETYNPEQNIIASLLQYPELSTQLRVTSDMFVDPYCKNVIEHIEAVGRCDLNEIYHKSSKLGKEFIPNDMLLRLRKDNFIKKTFFPQFQTDVYSMYAQRKIYDKSLSLQSDPSLKNAEIVLEDMKELLNFNIRKRETKQEVLKEITQIVTLQKKPEIYKTGYKQIDVLIGGFRPQSLVIVAARPSVGKTAFALNLGVQLEQQGCNVAFFSLETTEKSITRRVLSSIGKIEMTKFDFPEAFTTKDYEKYENAMKKYNAMNFTVDDNSVIKPSDIRRKASQMYQQGGKNIIIIDYLTLMQSDNKHKDMRHEVNEITRQLKIIAKDYNCVIIALSQLNRGVEGRADKRPMLSDLRESGSIEQDADIVAMLYRDDYYEAENNEFGKSIVECDIKKSKDTAVGMAKFEFYRPIQRYY
ncbi:damage-inducible protein [Macrococcoides goetzii]|nr:DnaB helicase C-terminal domain-containing protein [Macrococcus goetzii]TDM40246.1 damage-inducible protein [Macrococcus goetzii]